MITSGMYISNKECWETPQWLFDKLNEKYKFTLDVCASDTNHKCINYFTKEDNGLSKDWVGACWMNLLIVER